MNNVINRRLFFVLCWTTYVSAYLCRINFSSSMTKLGEGLAIGPSELGLITSLYFISYAFGQLVNGFIGDKVVPERFICLAIVGTTLMNFIISLSSSYLMVLVLWCLNGCFQSMFWGPLMRMLSQRFPEGSKNAVSTGMSCSMMVGYILSWSVLGKLLLNSSWKSYFFIPSLISAAMLVLWLLYISFGKKSIAKKPAPAVNLRQMFLKITERKLWPVTLVCICHGLIKESVSMWAPVILIMLLGLDVKQSLLYLLLFPMANFGGIFLSGALSKGFRGNIRLPLMLIFGIVAVCALVLMVPGIPPAGAVVMMVTISAVLYGGNNILLGIVPLSFSGDNMVSTLVGIFDFSSYMGAAAASFILGIFLTGEQLAPVALVWLAAAVAACAIVSRLRIANVCEKGLSDNKEKNRCATIR